MASRQLRRMLFSQMNRIAMTGIVVGSIIGFLIGDISGKIIIRYFMDGILGYN